MYIDTKTARSGYIGHIYKGFLDKESLNISDLAEKIGTSQPNLSNALNGKKSFSDKFFTKIGKAIGLTDKQIKDIFKQADLEELKYKYGEEVLEKFSGKEMTEKEMLEFIFNSKNISGERRKIIKDLLDD